MPVFCCRKVFKNENGSGRIFFPPVSESLRESLTFVNLENTDKSLSLGSCALAEHAVVPREENFARSVAWKHICIP